MENESLCWLCGWLEEGCQSQPVLIGGRVYTRPLCCRCGERAAAKIERFQDRLLGLSYVENPPTHVQPEPRSFV